MYRQIYSDLLDGPLSTGELTDFLNQLEPVLTPYLDEDPWIGGGAGAFDSLRSYFTNRINNVRAQIGALTGPPRFNQRGGEIIPGFQLTMTHTNASATIYYTLNGSDPRGLGGVIQGTAYVGALTLTNTTHITSRALDGTNWSALRQATFNVAGHANTIKVTEIMYGPAAPTNEDAGEYEFIELKNTGTQPVNLSGCYFTGIGYTFAPGTVVPPGAFIVLVGHPLAFAVRYPGVPFQGVYWGGLSRSGEKIRLRNSDGNNILSVEYDDDPPWPQGANGFGHSLVNMNPDGNPDVPDNWRESTLVNGSPGADDPAPPYSVGVVVNEVLAHTDPPLEDAIELYNTTTNDIDVSGWYLSDKMDLLDPARESLKKYRIPPGTIVPANGYKVFYEGDFNPGTTSSNALIKFALSSLGEEAWLSTADGAGDLTGHVVGFRFGASDNGVSVGRHLASTGPDTTFLSQRTFGADNPATVTEFRTGSGAPNSPPRIGPVVFNELMYHPAEGNHEFVEFFNASTSAMDLGGWRVDGADYIFPSNSIIAPQGLLVLLGTTNQSIETFRASNQIPANVPILAHAFDLQNAGEHLALSKPSDSPLDPPILVDRVRFNDRSPWPTEADGEGPSLERCPPTAYGNDPINWNAAAYGGTPGRPGVFTNAIAVATNSSWRHLAAGYNLGTPWRNTAYSDSGWPNSDGVIGFGQPFVDSILDFAPSTNPPVTTYFRKEFVINAEPGLLTRFALQANYDDGFLAWINGQEVARGSMPAGTIDFDTLASEHAGGSYESIDLLGHTNALVRGGNVLAVEVHQSSVNDPDLVWDAQLTYSSMPQRPPILITGAHYEPATGLTLEWSSVPGQMYYLQQGGNPNLWSDVGSPIEATESSTLLVLPISTETGMNLYRIRYAD